jgi:hypothetical protein
MLRLVVPPLLLFAACGDAQDDRPLELDYLTQQVFAPTCGATTCHSSFKQAGNVVFDTPDATRRSLIDGGLIRFNSDKYDPDDPNQADLIIWITQIDPFGEGIGRMPFDYPMPNKDVQLLSDWIAAQAPGAQCNPEENAGKACNNKEVVECTADWTFGPRVQLCATDCIAGKCMP